MSKKEKKPLKPTSLYQLILKEFKICGTIDPNSFNVALVLKELAITTEYHVADVISEDDVELAIAHVPHFYSPLAYALAKRNKTMIKDTEAFLKWLNKEIPEGEI